MLQQYTVHQNRIHPVQIYVHLTAKVLHNFGYKLHDSHIEKYYSRADLISDAFLFWEQSSFQSQIFVNVMILFELFSGAFIV